MVVWSEASWNVSRARYEDTTAAFLFRCGSGREKIIRLEARRFRVLKSAGGNKFRQHIELLEQGVVKFAAALVSWKFLMPVGGDVQGNARLGLWEPSCG